MTRSMLISNTCLNEIIMSKEEKKLFTEKSKNEAKN